MSLIKSNEANWLPSVFDVMFKAAWLGGTTNVNSIGTGIPAVHIQKTDDNFMVEFAAPRITRKDFNIELDNDIIRKTKFPRRTEGIRERNLNTAISKGF